MVKGRFLQMYEKWSDNIEDELYGSVETRRHILQLTLVSFYKRQAINNK